MNTRYVMGTFLSVQIAGHDASKLTQIFFEEVQRLEELLSIYKPESEISKINHAAGIEAVCVSGDTYDVVEKAFAYAEISGGAFDPSLRPWGYRQILLDSEKRTIFLQNTGMTLDLGGIGKGFALDHALARVRRQGSPQSVSTNFGGQLLFWHASGSFGPEIIIIEDPVNRDAAETFQITSNCSISTSSNAERPRHLRDPRTGKPVEAHGSVTVVAPTGTEAEALSTAYFIEGHFGVYGFS